MPLNWDLTHIDNYEEVCWLPPDKDGEQYINPVTDALIHYTAMLRMPGIGTSSWADFYKRVVFFEKMEGPVLREYDREEDGNVRSTPRAITRDDVISHIGLRTNGGNSTWNQFLKTFMESWGNDLDHNTDRYLEQLEKFEEVTA